MTKLCDAWATISALGNEHRELVPTSMDARSES